MLAVVLTRQSGARSRCLIEGFPSFSKGVEVALGFDPGPNWLAAMWGPLPVCSAPERLRRCPLLVCFAGVLCWCAWPLGSLLTAASHGRSARMVSRRKAG